MKSIEENPVSIESAIALAARPGTGHLFTLKLIGCQAQVFVNHILVNIFYYKSFNCISGTASSWVNKDEFLLNPTRLESLIKRCIDRIQYKKVLPIFF